MPELGPVHAITAVLVFGTAGLLLLWNRHAHPDFPCLPHLARHAGLALWESDAELSRIRFPLLPLPHPLAVRLRSLPADSSWAAHIHEEDRAATLHAIRCQLAGSPSATVEYRLAGDSGSLLWVRNTVVSVEPCRLSGVLLDITSHRESLAELERSNAQLHHFAAIVSHDLQEPLRVVDQYAQLLERRYDGQLSEEANRWIRHLVEGARRMQSLIRSILRFSSTGQRRRNEVTSSQQSFEQALAALQVAIHDTGAHVNLQTPLPAVHGDGVLLAQLFQNLVSNALHYGGEKPVVEIGVEACNGHWLFSVADHGIGIAPEHHDRIFGLFERGTETGREDGSGIGLAVCKRIIEDHGGRIWVESEPGSGATFRFTLPRA